MKIKELLNKIKIYFTNKKDINDIFNKIPQLEKDLTEIFNEVMTLKVISDEAAENYKSLAGKSLNELETYNTMLNDFYLAKEKIANSSTFFNIFNIIICIILTINDSSLAIYFSSIGVVLCKISLENRLEFYNKEKLKEFTPKYNDIKVIGQNILTFVNSKNYLFHQLEFTEEKQVEIEQVVCFEKQNEILSEELSETISENPENLPENAMTLARIKPQNDKKPKKS